MSKCRKWVLTLGLMAATPGITLAGPKLPFLKSERQAQPTRSTPAANNQRIADDIANALRVANISGFDIAIEQRNGTATLSGTVADARLKTRASEIVARVPGVIRVDNQLQVGGPATGSPDFPNEGDFFDAPPVQPVNFEATPPGAFPADAVRPMTAGQRSNTQDNQSVAQDIGDALAQAGLSGFDIEVRYADGTALLAGMVSDPGQRAKAEQAATSVPGVQYVENRLMIQGMPMAAPGQPIAPPQGYPGPAQFGPSPSPQPYRGGAQFGPVSYQPAPGQQPPMPNGAVPPPPYNMAGGPPGAPMPLTYGHPGAGSAESVYNSPNLPEYAWPSYASYPNYAQVAYPQDYSASAWPYIGPFYPYPQVPLGWRQVQLEWDDGSWNLNFRPRTDKWWWFLNPKNW